MTVNNLYNLEYYKDIATLYLTCKVIRMYTILYKLSQTILMHIDASRLTMVNLAFDHCGIGASLDLKSSNPIVVYIVFLEVALEIIIVINVIMTMTN